MSQKTRIGVGGPGKTFGTIAAKSPAASAAAQITRLGLGGPMRTFGTIAAKSAAGAGGFKPWFAANANG